MRRDPKLENAPAIVRQHQEDVEYLKSNGRDCEKVQGNETLHLVFRECAPPLGRRFSMSQHVFANGWLGDLDTQFEQLTMDARCAPQRIVATHPPDQITNSGGSAGRPSLPRRTLQVQNRRKPLRCQAMTVSGCTISRADFQSAQTGILFSNGCWHRRWTSYKSQSYSPAQSLEPSCISVCSSSNTSAGCDWIESRRGRRSAVDRHLLSALVRAVSQAANERASQLAEPSAARTAVRLAKTRQVSSLLREWLGEKGRGEEGRQMRSHFRKGD